MHPSFHSEIFNTLNMEIIDGEFIHIRRLNSSDAENVYNYLQALSPSSKKRFGPHPFDQESVAAVLSDNGNMTAYGAFENNSGHLIAYSLIRHGVISHDKNRYLEYGITLCETADCTFAPSVADAWQNKKIEKIFSCLVNLNTTGIISI
jgi:hypothetical protein